MILKGRTGYSSTDSWLRRTERRIPSWRVSSTAAFPGSAFTASAPRASLGRARLPLSMPAWCRCASADHPRQQSDSGARVSPTTPSPTPRLSARVSVAAACFDGGRHLPPPHAAATSRWRPHEKASTRQNSRGSLIARTYGLETAAPAMKDRVASLNLFGILSASGADL
ncbi:hypothetical protein MTO96_032863 [Rhipicephalus appendiculatus]